MVRDDIGRIRDTISGEVMHSVNDPAEEARSLYVEQSRLIERLQLPKDPHWGAHPADELAAVLAPTITPDGVGGLEALRVFRDLLMPACRPMGERIPSYM